MEKIAISTRVIESHHHEWRDSLAQDWTNHLWDQGYQAVLVPNHLASCREYLCDAALLILSGGDDILPQHRGQDSNDPRAVRDRTELSLLESAASENLPTLGVCRGMQLINIYFGGMISPISDGSHVATEHDVLVSEGAFGNTLEASRIRVNSFHNQQIATLGDGLEAVARADDGKIEALQHESKPIAGVMWHPERSFSDTTAFESNARLIRRLMDDWFSRRQ